jgi:hypothetical protein
MQVAKPDGHGGQGRTEGKEGEGMNTSAIGNYVEHRGLQFCSSAVVWSDQQESPEKSTYVEPSGGITLELFLPGNPAAVLGIVWKSHGL